MKTYFICLDCGMRGETTGTESKITANDVKHVSDTGHATISTTNLEAWLRAKTPPTPTG